MQSDCNHDSVAASPASAVAAAPAPRTGEADATCTNDACASERRRGWLDRLGVGVSITCAIHCVAAALLATAPAFAAGTGPMLGEGLEWLEIVLLWVALGIGSVALVPAYREHRRALPLALFGAGMAVITLSRLIDAEFAEIGGTVLGVTLVASAHLVNLRSRPHTHSHAH